MERLPVRRTAPRVALIAHDARKQEMAEWSAFNRGTLARCSIFATAATGRSVAEKLDLPHDVDVKTLLRLAVLYDVPIACNRRSADMLISSPLFMDLSYHEVNRAGG